MATSGADVNQTKYRNLLAYTQGLKVRDVRQLFAYVRKLEDEDPNILFPEYGITASEFAVMYIQNMTMKPRTLLGGEHGKKAEGSGSDNPEYDEDAM